MLREILCEIFREAITHKVSVQILIARWEEFVWERTSHHSAKKGTYISIVPPFSLTHTVSPISHRREAQNYVFPFKKSLVWYSNRVKIMSGNDLIHQDPRLQLREMREEWLKQSNTVLHIINTACLSNAMHRQLRISDVDLRITSQYLRTFYFIVNDKIKR